MNGYELVRLQPKQVLKSGDTMTGNLIMSGSAKVVGNLIGNSDTTTKLQTARTINGTSFDGSANIVTSYWGTARTITIGNTGKSVNGSATVSWTLDEIGAAASSHTHSYLPLGGGTMTGKITNSMITSTYLAGNQGNALINSSSPAGSYVMLYRYPSTNGYFTTGGYQGSYLLQYTAKTTVDAGTNDVTKSVTLLNENGNSSFPGTVTAPTFSGALSGNASSATKLATARTITIGNTGKTFDGSSNVSWSVSEIGAATASHTHNYAGSTTVGGAANSAVKLETARTINGVAFDGTANITIPMSGTTTSADKLSTARTINGTSFDGSANIVTSYWGTARTITIGNTGKSVNGSATVSWTLDEIGAAASSHTHSYLPLGGGTLTGELTVQSSVSVIGTLNMTGTIGDIKLSNGGCRIYGCNDNSKLYIEGGVYSNDTIQAINGYIIGNYTKSNVNLSGTEGRVVRGASDAIGSVKIQIGGNNSSTFEIVDSTWSTAWFTCGSSGIKAISYANFSDETLKTNIEKVESISDKMSNINIYNYNYLSDFEESAKVETTNCEPVLSDSMPKTRWGVIAQEVEEAFPELVLESDYLTDGEVKRVKSVDVYGLTVITLEYAKEIKSENDELKSRLGMLESKLSAITSDLGISKLEEG